MGKVIKQTDDGLPVFGNDDSDVLVVTKDDNGLPIFSKKKAASNGGGNGLSQPSPSQSQSPLQSGSVKTFDEPALKLSDGGVPVDNTPAQTAPTQNIDFNKLNAQHGIVAPTTEEKTVSAGSEQKVQEKVGNRNEAIANTLSKKYGNNQNSPEYRKEFNGLLKKLNDGDVVLTHAQDGKPFVVRSQGFLESAGKSLIESFKAPIEGFKIQSMDGKELADYLDKKSAEQPYLEESAPSPFLGELGSAAGGFPKIAGEFGINEAVPFLGTGIATADAELSAAGNKTAELYQKNLKELTDNGVPLEKARIEAADKAKKDAPLAAAPDALLTAALGEYGADTKGISDAAQTFKQTLIKSGESIGKFGVLGGAAGASEAGIEKAQGYDISMKDALDKFGEEGFQYATMDAMFKILPVASKLPSAAYRAWKEYMTKIPAPQFLDEIDNQVKNGTMTQDEADKAAANLGGYVKAKNKTIPTGNVEKDGLITELVQEKLKLEEDKKTLDPNFHKEKDKQIADIDSKINLVKYSKHPIETDDITGEFNLNPKTHDELSSKEKEGIVVPKEYGGTEVEEVGGKGEDAETKYKPTAYFTDKKGSLELKQPIEVGDKTYSDKQKAQAAADKALKQHYYENGLHESGKPQKKQQDNGLQLQKEEETSKVTEPATAGAGGETAPDKTKATIDEKPLSPDERISIYDKLSPEQQQEAIDAELESEGAGDKYLKSVNNGKTLPNAAAEEKPKEEPQAEVIQPKTVEGNQPSNEPQPSEEIGVAETKPIEPAQEPTENKVEPSKFPKPQIPLNEMNSEQLDNYANTVKDYSKNQEVEFFGKEGAKEYREAQSISNSSFASHDKRQEAYKIIDKYEKQLTPQQHNEFFGINAPEGLVYDHAELRDIATKVRLVEESENLDELASSAKNALMQMNEKSPSIESKTILNAVRKKADELNIKPEQLIKEVLKKVGNQYKDGSDAEFMMQTTLQKLLTKEEPAKMLPETKPIEAGKKQEDVGENIQGDKVESRDKVKGTKVADKEGNPVVVYHGSARKQEGVGKIEQFDESRINKNESDFPVNGFFFAARKGDADAYGGDLEGKNTGSYYVDIKNPASFKDVEQARNEAATHPDYDKGKGEFQNTSLVRKILVDKGFDGYIAKPFGKPNMDKLLNGESIKFDGKYFRYDESKNEVYEFEDRDNEHYTSRDAVDVMSLDDFKDEYSEKGIFIAFKADQIHPAENKAEKSNQEQGVQESDTTKKPQGTESQAPKKEQQKPEKQKDNSVVGSEAEKKPINTETDTKIRNADKGGLKATIAGVMSMVGSHTSDVAKEGKGLEGKRTEKNATIEDTSKIKLEDNRETDAVTGDKVSDTKKLTSDASVKTIKEVVQAANKHDIDPYTMLAIAFQETGIAADGDTEANPFHLIDNRADNLIDEGAKLFKEKMKIADSKGKKTEEERIQAFNGYGKVGKHTEGQQKSLYGIDVSKEPIDMNKNPVYGKRIIDIRENIIKKNPELVKLVEGERGNVLYDRSNASLKDDKNVGDYVAKAKSVLETLYPKAKLEVYDSEKEYLKNGGEPNTRGLGILDKNGEHRILLNLDQIKKDNSGKTAFHEVLHPIVYDAFGVSKDKLVPLWNSIADAMENVKGFEKVSEHISFYDKDQIPQEGLTELLTQIATGNIDLTDVPKSKANKIIDLVNKLFETLGIHLKLNSVEDFHSIANKIKDAFESGDAKDLKDVIKGNNIDKYITDLEKRLKDRDLSQEQYKEKIEKLKSLGYSDEDIKAAFKRKGIAEEKVNEILSQTKTENDAIKEGEQPEGNIPEHQDRESGGKATETSGSNSPVGSGEKQQGQKEVGGEPPKEPPKTGEFSSLPQKERVRGAYQHLINSDIPKDIKEKMEKEGLSPKGTSISYKVADNEESQKVGKATIQSFGVDEALNLARQGTFHPSVNSSVFAEAINHFQELESNAKTSAEKLDYAQKWADTYDEYAQQLTGAGQFSQYAYQYYKTSKLGFVISAERKFNDRRDYFTGKAEKNLKSIIEDIENEPEFQEYLKGKVADEYFKDKGVKNKVVAKLNDTAAKIRKEGLGSILPSWAKADVGGAQKQSIVGKTLDDIVATSLETIAKGIEAGEKIGDLVRDAISNIKSGGATANDKEISDWLYGQFKGTQKDATESYKERLRNQIKDLDEQITNKERKQKEIKKTDYDDETKDLIKERDEKKKQLREVVPLQKSAEKILQKWDKKLSNLDPEKRKELLQKVLTEITQNGGLDLDTFKSMYADALGLPSLTPEMRTKLLELGARLNSVDKATEELSKNPTQENIDAYLKSMQDGEKASSEINDLFGEKGITLDRFLNIAKLNTLGVANLVMNPLYNINFMPVRFAESLVKTGLDYGLKYMGFARDADGVYENALYKQFGYYGGFKQGLQKSIHDVVRGQTQIDYFKKTTRQNIRPLTSLKELISHYKGENPLTKAEVANAMVEAFPTMGASAAVISRALQVGDLPFRFAAERAMAENIARQKGLSGIEKDAFVLNPNEASKKLITDAGERAVMQQDNELTKLITRLSSAFKYAGGESRATKVLSGIGKVIGATTQPFIKIPLNSAMSVLELAVPEFSAAKGIYHALHGERDLALNAFSRMAVGIAIGAAYSQIAQAGLISSTSNSPDKINASIAKEDVYGGNDLNYSAFLRWMSGGGAGWKNDDVFLNLNAFGVSGNIMALYGAKYDKLPPDQWNKLSYLDGLSNRMSSSFIDGLKNNVFSNTSTLIDAMSSGNAYSVNKWLRGSSNVLLNSFDPSWLSMASKLKNDFKVDYTAMSLKDQMASTLKERFWNKDDLPKQITVWGEDRKLTPNGANPLLYYYADVTKSRRLDPRDFGYNILSLYNRTKDDSVIPSRPQKTIRQNNQSKQLNPKEYEQLQVLVGQSRKAQAQAMMAGQFQNEEGEMVSFSDLNDEQKIKILDKTYSKGYEIGKRQFLIKNPGFFQNDKK